MKFKSILLFIFLLLSVSPVLAQQDGKTENERFTLLFRGTPIEEAIKDLVKETRIDLIYDPSILSSQRVFSLSKNEYPEQILSNILKGTNLDYIQLSSGTYVIIKSAVNEPRYGSLAGIVLDKSTGKPLEGANVLIADASTGTSSNGAGRFTIAPLLTGNYEITITYVGYQTVRDTVSIPRQQDSLRRFYLESRPVFVEPLVISSLQKRLPYYNSGKEEVTNLTNSLSSYTGSPDALRSVESVMGVNFSIPLADFNIQGGAEGEHQVMLDGVPIYNPTSFGRLTGAFSPYALQKITVHKAGYGSSVGSQLSGIISIDQDLPADEEKNLMLQVDPLSLNGRINLATSINDDIQFKTMIAGRSNIWRWYQKPALSNTLENWDRLDPIISGNLINNGMEDVFFEKVNHRSDVDFYDFHWSNEIAFSDFHTTYFSYYRGTNYLQTRLLSDNSSPQAGNPESMYTRDTYDWLNDIVRVEHNWLINSRWQTQLGFSYSNHYSNHHFGMASTDDISAIPSNNSQLISSLDRYIDEQPHTGDQNLIRETTFNARFEYSLNQDHKLNFGIESKVIDYSFSLSDLFYHFSSSRNSTVMLNGFLEDEFSLNFNTKLIGGSRFTFIPNEQKIYAEPRISVQTDLQETHLGFISLKLAGGVYRQYVNQFDLTNVGPSSIVPSIRFWVPVDFTTDVPKSYHASSEILIEPEETLSIKWEGYYKWNPSVLSLDYHALLEEPDNPNARFNNQSTFTEQGRSYSYGTGISIEKLFEDPMMEFSLSYEYSLARKRTPKRFNGQYVDTPWNEPQKLQAAVNWNIIPSLLTTIRWQSIWGRSWAYNQAYYDYLTIDGNQSQYGTITFDSPSNDTLSPYHQLDIGFSWSQNINRSKVQLRLDLVNILDRQNTLEKRLIPQQNNEGTLQYTTQPKTLPGFTPSIGIRFIY
ncbi:TonB-dependent receptor [Balneolaceae bacterium YR4-1]|uniref:TonB-dependent receptor n=1 Tax=Halalkalibaculum roseum TaxID=2709311 RepID=A0A6M1SX25_9BACT|nr:TonB-dependent receptor [Halalkalibaculum roseum]NGP76758.1 TonB-dependent receptor [Halalkalibaculum roseum]